MVSITYERSSLVLKMNYDERCVRDIKRRMPKGSRSWNPELRCWFISPFELRTLVDILSAYYSSNQIYIDEDVPTLTTLDDIRGHRQKRTPYSDLFLVDGAPREVVVAAYRALCKIHHPDVGGDVEIMKRINIAYERINK